MGSGEFSSAAQLSSAFLEGLLAELSSAQQKTFPAKLAQLCKNFSAAQLRSAQLFFVKICNSVGGPYLQ